MHLEGPPHLAPIASGICPKSAFPKEKRYLKTHPSVCLKRALKLYSKFPLTAKMIIKPQFWKAVYHVLIVQGSQTMLPRFCCSTTPPLWREKKVL